MCYTMIAYNIIYYNIIYHNIYSIRYYAILFDGHGSLESPRSSCSTFESPRVFSPTKLNNSCSTFRCWGFPTDKVNQLLFNIQISGLSHRQSESTVVQHSDFGFFPPTKLIQQLCCEGMRRRSHAAACALGRNRVQHHI